MGITTISAREFARRHAEGVHALDVRTPAEHAGLHVEGAVCCPVGEWQTAQLLSDLRARGFSAQDTLYLLCQSGRRAQMAAEQIARESDVNVVVVDGGTEACVAAGLPVRQGGRRVWSLERQVRVAAGFLVLSGVVLGTLVAPGWYVLSGFVGAGLMFAGITDTCAMGMLIARMPWNRG
jgi:rhodanese-related sulfurtransferase